MKHTLYMRSLLIVCLASLAACGPNETVMTDGRIHVATGSYTEARMFFDQNGDPLIGAVRDEEARSFEIISFDGARKCTVGELHGTDIELLSSTSPSANNVNELRVSLLDSTDGVGELRFAKADCSLAMDPIADVVAPTTRITIEVLGVGAVASSWIAQTANGDLHLINPWSRTDSVIGHHVTFYTNINHVVWFLSEGRLVRWDVLSNEETARIGANVTEATVSFSDYGYEILYVDGGNVFSRSFLAAESLIHQLTESADACDVRFLGGVESIIAWKSPCAEQRLSLISVVDAIAPTQIDGPIGDVAFRDGRLMWVADPDTAPSLWIESLALDEDVSQPTPRSRIGAGDDLGSIRMRPFSVDRLSTSFFVTLDDEEGGNIWGVWAAPGLFMWHESNVGTTRLVHIGPPRSLIDVVIVPTNVHDGSGDLKIYDTIATVSVGSALDVRLDSVSVPFNSSALMFLQSWDDATQTGDLVGVDLSGTETQLERGVSMYSAIEIPVSLVLYTIPNGERQGVWMWIGGRAGVD